MLTVQTSKPDTRLAPFVRLYVQREAHRSKQDVVEPVVARLGTMLEFQFARPYDIPVYGTTQTLVSPKVAVIGPVTRRQVRLVIREGVEALAVLFQPQGFRALWKVPNFLVTDLGTDASGVLGRQVVELYDRLGNAVSFTRRVDLLNQFLLHCLSLSKPLDDIHRVLNHLIVSDSGIKISQAAQHAGVTIRQLERKSLEYTGVSPKVLMRIARFQKILKLKNACSSSWTEAAQDLQYYDQMHMIRDFHVFAGESPVRASNQIQPDHLISF